MPIEGFFITEDNQRNQLETSVRIVEGQGWTRNGDFIDHGNVGLHQQMFKKGALGIRTEYLTVIVDQFGKEYYERDGRWLDFGNFGLVPIALILTTASAVTVAIVTVIRCT